MDKRRRIHIRDFDKSRRKNRNQRTVVSAGCGVKGCDCDYFLGEISDLNSLKDRIYGKPVEPHYCFKGQLGLHLNHITVSDEVWRVIYHLNQGAHWVSLFGKGDTHSIINGLMFEIKEKNKQEKLRKEREDFERWKTKEKQRKKNEKNHLLRQGRPYFVSHHPDGEVSHHIHVLSARWSFSPYSKPQNEDMRRRLFVPPTKETSRKFDWTKNDDNIMVWYPTKSGPNHVSLAKLIAGEDPEARSKVLPFALQVETRGEQVYGLWHQNGVFFYSGGTGQTSRERFMAHTEGRYSNLITHGVIKKGQTFEDTFASNMLNGLCDESIFFHDYHYVEHWLHQAVMHLGLTDYGDGGRILFGKKNVRYKEIASYNQELEKRFKLDWRP